MINVKNLWKSFGNIKAIKDVSFDIKKGEVVGLLGPNGAGKTTTMRVITGYMKPDKGTVHLDSTQVSHEDLKPRKILGYLPENAPLYLDMEVTDFLKYVASIRGIENTQIDARIKEMVETCKLGDVVGRPIGALSKGFRQRVGLAQALIHHPSILILDEPTSGLDPNQIMEIRSLIKEIGKERTVILSTHIMQEVEATCSRAIIINSGAVIAEGTLSNLQTLKSGAAKYYVTVKAPRAELEQKLGMLPKAKIERFAGNALDEWQQAIIIGEGKENLGAEIFNTAVQNKWVLKELHEEKASLEDVFRSLTT